MCSADELKARLVDILLRGEARMPNQVDGAMTTPKLAQLIGLTVDQTRRLMKSLENQERVWGQLQIHQGKKVHVWRLHEGPRD